jgi:hypothetical protein
LDLAKNRQDDIFEAENIDSDRGRKPSCKTPTPSTVAPARVDQDSHDAAAMADTESEVIVVSDGFRGKAEIKKTRTRTRNPDRDKDGSQFSDYQDFDLLVVLKTKEGFCRSLCIDDAFASHPDNVKKISSLVVLASEHYEHGEFVAST